MTAKTGSALTVAQVAQAIVLRRQELKIQPHNGGPQRLSDFTNRLRERLCRSSTLQELDDVDWEDTSRHETPDSLWRKCGLGRREIRACDSLFDRETAPKWWKVYDYLEARLERGLLAALVGEFGSGKTVMGAHLLREMCKRFMEKPSRLRKFQEPLYTTAPQMFRTLMEAQRDGNEGRVLGRYLRPMLLVVDEAHERPDTEAQDRRMREIIDLRYKSERDTLLITNMKPEALGESIGGAAIDRIRQCGGMIPCNWGSFRHSKGGATK